MKMFYHLYFLIDPLSISNIRYFRRHAETYQTKCLQIFGPHNLVALGHSSGPPKKGLCMSSTGFFLSFVGRIPKIVPGKTLVGRWESRSSSQSMPAFRSSFSKHPIIRGAVQLLNYS